MPFLDRPVWGASPYSNLLDTVISTLQADPILGASGGVKTWRLWTGDDDDTRALEWDELPAVAITASLGAGQRQDESSHRVPLNLKVELYQRGTRQQHLLDFWAALCNALSPAASNSVLSQLLVNGGYSLILSGPVQEPRTFAQSQLGLYGAGSISILTRFES